MKFLILGLLICMSLSMAATLSPAHAAGTDATTQMLNGVKDVNLPSGGDKPEDAGLKIVSNVIKIFLSLLGIIFFVLMLFAGYKWMMASGREEEVSTAKDTIRAAIIGLIIILAAYAITLFITNGLQNAIK